MNVNPVAASGAVSSARLATRTEGHQASTTASERGDVRERQTALAAEPNSNTANTAAERDNQTAIADRQKAEQLKAFIGDANFRLSTYHDQDSGRSILEVRDQTTGDVVSQYPSEELIRLYAALRQSLVDQSA